MRGGGGAFESGPGGASDPHGTAGFAVGFTAGRSSYDVFALGVVEPATGVATPIIVPWPVPGFTTGSGLSGEAGPSNVFLNADAAAGAAGAAGAIAGFAAAPNADAAPSCEAGAAAGFANAEPAAPSDGAAAGGFGGAAESCGSTGSTLPSFAIMKLVLHFGQRIFMPVAGMRRSSTSYGDLHDTHSTLIMDDRHRSLGARA
jgi:hypothetical protein